MQRSFGKRRIEVGDVAVWRGHEISHYVTSDVRQRVTYTATRKGYHLIVDDVPAWVGAQCGEPLFSEQTVDMVQEILRQVDATLVKYSAPPIAPAAQALA